MKSKLKGADILETNNDGFFTLDREWRFTYINRRAAEISGKGKDEVIGKIIWDLYPDLKGTVIEKTYRDAMEKGTIQRTEMQGLGTGCWYNIFVVPAAESIGVYLHDISEQKKQAEELRVSEEEALEIIDGFTEGSWIVDLLKGTIKCSEKWAKRIGLDRVPENERLAYNHTLSHPDDTKNANSIEYCIEAGKTRFDLEYRVKTIDCGYIWTQNRGKIVYDGQGKAVKVYAATVDITERKKTAEALRESEERFRTVQDNSLDRFSILKPIFNDSGDITDFTYVYHNAQASRIVGRRPDEIIGKRVSEIFPAFSKTRNFTIYKQVIETGQALEIEDRYNFDGVDEWFRATLTPVPEGIAVAAQSINERKQAEEALRESEEKYRLLFENAECGSCLVEPLLNDSGVVNDLRYLEVNPAFEKHTGLKASTFLGKRLMEALPGIEVGFLKGFDEAFKSGETTRYEGFNRDTGRWYEQVVFPYYKGLLGEQFIDITERKKAEEALRESGEEEAFLLKLSDALRPLSDAKSIQNTASRLLADQMKASQANYTEYYDDSGYAQIQQENIKDSKSSMVGRYAIGDYNSFISILRSGSDLVIPDVLHFAGIPEDECIRLAERGFRAQISVPLTKNQKLVATLTVRQVEPREWTPQEVILVRETAERTWADLERARAEIEKERLIALMDNNPSLVFLKDEAGRYVYLNKAYEMNFVHSGDWHGKTDFDFWPKESAELFRANDSNVLNSGHTMQFMEDSTDMEGKRYCWLNYKFPFIDSNNRKYVGGIGIDATRLILAEDALRESEERFRSVVQNTSAIILRVDPKGVIRFANQRALGFFGYTEDELVGKHAVGTIVPGQETPGRDLAAMVDEISSNPDHFHTNANENMLKNGERVWMEWTNSGVYDSEGRLKEFLAVGIDATERKRMEEALRESEAKFREVFENSQIGIIAGDLEGRILFSNPAIERMLGYGEGELRGKVFSEFTFPEDLQVEMPLVSELLEGKRGHYEIEKRYIRKDGQVIWVKLIDTIMLGANGEKYGLAMVEDITGHKKAEQALRESEEKYRMLVEHSPAGIYEIDFRSGRFTSVNDAMCGISGYSKEEMLSMTPFELLDEESKVRFQQRIRKWLAGEKPKENVDYKIITKDGREIYASLSVKFTRDEKGDPLGASVVAHDVTERKRAEMALRESEKKTLALVKELEKADINKNQFISALSHELRNPLAVISAGIQLLDVSRDEEHIKDAKNIMNRQMNQLCSLVDDLLDLTRISNNKIELKKERIELGKLALHTAEDHRSLFEEKEITLHSSISSSPIYIDADPVRLKQIIGNLLHNALKYTQTGGKVIMRVCEENGKAAIFVKDNGKGLSIEIIPRLFQPFVQADMSLDRVGGGLGLGLSITKGIAELHGGTVSALSEGLGKGSEFIIRLPLSDKKSEYKPNDEKQIEVFKSPLKLLIIDDNKDLTDLMCSLLRTMGHQAFTAYDGNEGILKAKEIRPDIVFCDIGLPGINGYDVADIFKKDDCIKNIYLVALTGYAGEADVKRAKDNGFDKHMVKPMSLAVLQQFLSEYKVG